MVTKDLLKSDAWAVLRHSSRVGYIHLLAKCFRPNQEQIELTCQEMRRFMDPGTFVKAMEELERIGFIEITRKGGLHRYQNFYRIVRKWIQFNVKNPHVDV